MRICRLVGDRSRKTRLDPFLTKGVVISGPLPTHHREEESTPYNLDFKSLIGQNHLGVELRMNLSTHLVEA